MKKNLINSVCSEFENIHMHQSVLFDDFVTDELSINNAAAVSRVTGATIRNWLKVGHIKSRSKGKICANSLYHFLESISVGVRLKSRANKSLKDGYEFNPLIDEFMSKVTDSGVDGSILAEQYESRLSDAYKNKEGIYYTPKKIVEEMLSERGGINLTTKFLDPCCGSGNFIIRALELGVDPMNIYGCDVDPVAVGITRKRVYEKTGFISENIQCLDFLDQNSSLRLNDYDLIYTNPPWGKKFNPADKDRYLKRGKRADSCTVFFDAALSVLKPGGEIGFLMPESFFNIAGFELDRRDLLRYEVLQIIDYDRPFKGLLTKAFGFSMRKVAHDGDFQISCKSGGQVYCRSSKSFVSNPKAIINFQSKPDFERIRSHIYAFPHKTLKDNAEWALGIVTGDNKKYIKDHPFEGGIPVYKGADISDRGLSTANSFISADFSLYQQVAPIDLYKSPEKIIYKFISRNLCFYHDCDQRFILNSANMIVLHDDFPVSHEAVCFLFNSEFMRWIFRGLFQTHKILRGDLECLPVFFDYFQQGGRLVEDGLLEYLSLERKKDGTYRIKE